MHFGNYRNNEDFNNEEDIELREDLDFEDDAEESSILRWVSILFVLAAVGGFVALAWYAYQSGMQPVSEDEIPYVSAESENYKEKPADPGGWQFDHQDKSVYNQLAAGKGAEDKPVERILPAPEEPVERPQVEQAASGEFTREPVAGEANTVDTPIPTTQPASEESAPDFVEEVPVASNVETIIHAPEPAPAPEAEEAAPVAEAVTTVESSPAPVAAAPVTVEPEPKAAPAPAPAPVVATPAPAPATTAAASGRYMAQLGAFSSDAEARAAWNKISAAHGQMFPTKTYAVERADLGTKGVFHRLQVGPFDSDLSARKVCEYLQQNKQGCFVVKK